LVGARRLSMRGPKLAIVRTKTGPFGAFRPILLGCALALAGCASVPKLGPTAARRDPASLAGARALAAPAAAWPSDQWWRAYGDAQLDALIGEGLADSPSVAAAEARLRRAQALAERARANRGPELTGNAKAEIEKQSYNQGFPPQFVPHGWRSAGEVTLNLAYDFDFWGRNRAALAAATSDARAAAADAAEARLALSTAIASAYAELARLHAERDVAVETARVREQSLGLVAQRVANGLDSMAERRRAEAEVPRARGEIVAIDESIALAHDQIAALVGAGPDRGLAIAPPAARVPHSFGLPPNLAADLIGRRPDIVAARWRAEAATQRVRQARAAFYPNVNLNALIGFQALGLANLFASGSNIGSAGPAISLPIFDSGRIRADYRGARAEGDAAVASYDETLVGALREVADAAASERALGLRLAGGRLALAASEEAYRLARLRYQGQLSNYLSVLDAEDRMLAARRAVSDLEARAFTLDVALVRALGGGFGAG
jgi:NodT family efflux transporter outer membrane factor (OMF) lipoprotein